MYQKEGFHQRFKGGDLDKSKFSGLGGVLETSYHFTTLQKVGNLLTSVLFPSYGLIYEECCIGVLRAYLADF